MTVEQYKKAISLDKRLNKYYMFVNYDIFGIIEDYI